MLMVRCAEHGAQKQRCFYYHSHANTLHYEQAPLTQVHRPVRGNTDGRVKASSKMLAVRENYLTSRGGTFFGGRDLRTLGARDSATAELPPVILMAIACLGHQRLGEERYVAIANRLTGGGV